MNSESTKSLQFPLLGLREGDEPFQYLPMDIRTHSVRIQIFNWFVSRVRLNSEEQIDLLLPFFLNPSCIFHKIMQGKVKEVSSKEQWIEYEIQFEKETSWIPLKEWDLELICKATQASSESITKLLLYFVKDAMLLKSGVRIYLSLLIALFSRLSEYSKEEYSHINVFFLSDVEKHVQENERKFQELNKHLSEKLKNPDDILSAVNLEELREMVESEISITLMNVVFSNLNQSTSNPLDTLFYTQTKNPCISYLKAIKNLERRLYINYNIIVFIYSHAMKNAFSLN